MILAAIAIGLISAPASPVFNAQIEQMPGIVGTIGKIHPINKNNPLLVTLRSAEYSATRLSYGGYQTIPNANEKLLVLKFSIQNPQKREVALTSSMIRFTAVSENESNYENAILFGKVGTKETIRQKLKPAQRIELITSIIIPADLMVPKLIIQPTRGDQGKVIRYDLRNKIRALAALYTGGGPGHVALERVPAPRNTFLPMASWDVSIGPGAFTELESHGGYRPSAPSRLFSVLVSLKNGTSRDLKAIGPNYHAELDLQSGETIRHRFLRNPGLSSQLSVTKPPGEETKGELLFVAPMGSVATKLRFWEHWGGGKSRVYEFDFSPK